MLYVNNIRAYYNIIRWLTDNEVEPEEEATSEETDLVAMIEGDEEPAVSED